MIQSQLQKVKSHVLSNIESGKWMPNDKIPSEFDLVKLLSISRSTVNRALKELTTEGYLTRIQGLGTFVADKKTRYALMEIKNIADEIADKGGTHSCEVITLEAMKADTYISQQLEIKKGSQVFFSRIVHYMSGIPIELAERYINPKFAPNYLEQNFQTISPSEYLFSLGPLTEAEHIIEAIIPDEATRSILQIENDEACLIIHRRTWSKNMIVNYARLLHPASRFTPSSRFSPKDTGSRIMH
ncbi:histidine utilization repressor [Desulforhopalus singaporensis]|uniref:Histidine utilization repressor n=1 Tax=Desulforhopalus singaporensis TaxID=91360 RepID=A0A1H0UDK6_9BACT|nr:histidine utilization repressor [Desulforhopalus singaporensis]SDP64269.1 GntR family transcriptional regulator, histidine utilization repressor [Desulforhopalus singaporensis]